MIFGSKEPNFVLEYFYFRFSLKVIEKDVNFFLNGFSIVY